MRLDDKISGLSWSLGQGFGESRNVADLNWGTEEQRQNILGNINHFRDQKAENKFVSNSRNKETR